MGVGDAVGTAAQWTLNAVLAAMDLADIFYTQGTTSGKVALVQEYACTAYDAEGSYRYLLGHG